MCFPMKQFCFDSFTVTNRLFLYCFFFIKWSNIFGGRMETSFVGLKRLIGSFLYLGLLNMFSSSDNGIQFSFFLEEYGWNLCRHVVLYYVTRNVYRSPCSVRTAKLRRLQGPGMWLVWGDMEDTHDFGGQSSYVRWLERPRKRWKNDIKMDLSYINGDNRRKMILTEECVQWQAFVFCSSPVAADSFKWYIFLCLEYAFRVPI
jgi:hypothetical protein